VVGRGGRLGQQKVPGPLGRRQGAQQQTLPLKQDRQLTLKSRRIVTRVSSACWGIINLLLELGPTLII
jgi:hypothetical protein